MNRCWVESAHDSATDFPLENLPFGVFEDGGNQGCIGVAIGDAILDLSGCAEVGLLDPLPWPVRQA
ncbi:MAG: fumarylacetoacetase, partial [Acidobacteriaceae bacterium]